MSDSLHRVLDPRNQRHMLISALGMVLAIALIDWWVQPYISIGFLYLIPVLLVSASFPRYQIIVAGLICAVLQEAFAQLPESERIIRLIFSSIGFVATGLFVSEVVRNRDRILRHAEELRRSMQLRQDAEGQLQLLVDTSPAAIVTIDAEGRILIANEAARQLLAGGDGSLEGQLITSYLPTLQIAIQDQPLPALRTSLQCRGQRSNGESFLAGIWFSTYATVSGSRLTAIVADLSDDLVAGRTSSLDHTLRNTKILMSGMTHEVRNVCSAMRVIYKNLRRIPELTHSEDFRALDSLIHGLDKISTEELRGSGSTASSMVRLPDVLDELRVLVDSAYSDSGIAVHWKLDSPLPLVRADRFGLVQVFLNLASNSKRAMESTQKKELQVDVTHEANSVVIRVADTGTGISSPEKLFRPFQPGSSATGLGLYLSRSIMRSFGGDLISEPKDEGSCFAVLLPVPATVETNAHG